MAVTVHFIDENCELNSHLLSCSKFSEKHTSENLKSSLLEITENWGIRKKIVAYTSDNAANISLAVSLCQWGQHFCFAHNLNLIVQSSLNEINETREKVKSIVEFFKRSTNASENLNKMQEQLGFTPTLMLIQDVITRWNSTFDIFQRFVHLKTPIISALSNSNRDVELTLSDWNTLTQSCDILERFKEITIDLSSEKSVSISKVILYSQALITYSTQLSTKDLTPQVNNMVIQLKLEINKRFGNYLHYESNPLLSEATFLDPRFKKYGFQNEQSFKKIKKIVINKGKRIITQSRSTIDQNVSVPAVVNNIGKENSIWQEFDAGVENVVQSLNPTASIIVEVDKYLQEPPIPRTQDPLKWWDNNRQIYPTLYIMMKKRLCIQAASVSSERVFSKSGQIVSTKHSRLLSKKVEQIVFLNYNLK
ncbi:zinc finger BED domain-containing protein 1-like [Acyrthosiphon pisum]|uniref:HAT C-terminal dimerisation domain-containing protein n=1 Tax=Acyrthosiphon pisum TaxID=7029 RepID=A0A8R2JLK4_ACYPI|nr:zinc finger BED domain-containing protein 1-like [Acyrthosiphon pisum]